MVIQVSRKLSNLLVVIVLFLITIILLKSSPTFNKWFAKNILNNNISFVKIAKKYETLVGKPLPFKKFYEEPVFDEKLKYLSKEDHNEGVLLKLENNLVPSINKGLVIFVGTKDNEKCLTIEGNDYDVTYCGLTNIGVKLYDHVEIGEYIGEVKGELILYFIKDGEYLNYEEFI